LCTSWAGGAQVDLAVVPVPQAAVVGVAGPALVLFLEDRGVHALLRLALGVVDAVLVHRVDEEQAQHLHTQRAQALFLVQVFLDRAADHLALDGQRLQAAPALIHREVLLAARQVQLHQGDGFRAAFDSLGGGAQRAHTHVGVDLAACGLLQVVAVLHHDFLALHAAGPAQHVQFHRGRYHAPLVADGHQLDVGLVVALLHRG